MQENHVKHVNFGKMKSWTGKKKVGKMGQQLFYVSHRGRAGADNHTECDKLFTIK